MSPLTLLLYVVGVAGMFLLLIGPHEAGHFLFAKLFKVRVIEFSIGAGTKLWSVTRGGTLYAVRLLPILGYVRMGGMEAGDFDAPHGFHSKPAWQRIVILSASELFLRIRDRRFAKSCHDGLDDFARMRDNRDHNWMFIGARFF